MGQFKFIAEKTNANRLGEYRDINCPTYLERWLKHFEDTDVPAAIIKSKDRFSLWRVTKGTTEKVESMPNSHTVIREVHDFRGERSDGSLG